ncbi:MAG: hypothetical protein KDI36_09380 [Pseudomonadales bacterium]|nr:hypothetical protein [Pseudomonadales bacterium]
MKRLVLMLYLVLPGWFMTAPVYAALEDFSNIQLITEVDVVVSTADVPPPDSADWQPMTIPRGSRVTEYINQPRMWLRFYLDNPGVTEHQALYFWRYNMSLTVFMNGVELGGDTFKTGRQTLAWNHPRLVQIQSRNWQPGKNVFHIRFNNSPFGGAFVLAAFGPEKMLRPIYEERLFWNVTTNESLLVFGILIIILTIVLWCLRPRDSIYPWFIAVCGCWCIITVHMVVYYNLVPYQYWLPLVHVAIDGWTLATVGFINRLMNFHWRRLEYVAIALFCLATLSHIFTPRGWFWIAAYGFHFLGLILILIVTALIVRQAQQNRTLPAISVCLALAGQLLLAAADMRLFIFGEQVDWTSATHVSHFGLPLLLLTFAINLLVRFNNALKESETLNRELESRVEAGRRALEESYQENRALELTQAAEAERQKIYRDIHDDVGSKLASMVHTDDADTLHSLARSALEGVREAIYRVNFESETLLAFLLRLRQESQLRLESAGLQVQWFEDPDLPDSSMDPHQRYHLSRILRELVTNVIHHAHATAVSISWDKVENRYQLEFSDNGVGIEAGRHRLGSGLSNIEYRCGLLGGQANWQGSAEGTRFSVSFTPKFLPAQDDPVSSAS